MAGFGTRRVALLFLLPLALGWFLSLFYFGKFHTEAVKDGVPPWAAGYYVNEFLQFWLFSLVTPALAVLVVLNVFKNDSTLGLITGVAAAITAVALGGCLTETIRYINEFVVTRTNDESYNDPYLGYAGTGLAGELLAMIALLGLIGVLSGKKDD